MKPNINLQLSSWEKLSFWKSNSSLKTQGNPYLHKNQLQGTATPKWPNGKRKRKEKILKLTKQLWFLSAT